MRNEIMLVEPQGGSPAVRTKIISRASASMLALCLAATGAEAQSGPQADPQRPAEATAAASDEADQSNLGEIIITARKRSESLVDVPISVTAVTGEQLRAQGTKNFDEYAGKVPGLALFSRGPTSQRGQGATFGIRGVSGGLSDPPVGFYLNDTPLAVSNLKLFDIDTIEILKGPQGTLYGARALGGLIKVSTRRPDLQETSGTAEIEPSFTDNGGGNLTGNAALNIPIVSDRVALRVSGYGVYEEGYVDRLPGATAAGLPLPAANSNPPGLLRNVDDEMTWGGRASLLFKANEDVRIVLDYVHQHARQDDRSEWDLPLSKALGRPYTSGSFIAQPSSTDFDYIAATADVDLGKIGTLTSATSYVDSRSLDIEDLSYLSQAVLGSLGIPGGISVELQTPAKNEAFTQEFRLSSDNPAWFNYTVGAFYQNSQQRLTLDSRSAEFGNLVNTAFGFPLVTNGLIVHSLTQTKVKELGAFGELYLRPTQSLSVTLGGRYFDNRAHVERTTTGFFASTPTSLKSHDNGFNPKATVSWAPADRANIYVSATKGFRRGGANSVDLIPPNCGPDLAQLGLTKAPGTFKSDNLWQYEIGAKAALRNGVSFEAAAFRTNWNDRQLLVFLPNCGFSFGSNVGKSRIDGAELSVHFRHDRWLALDGTMSYLKGRVLEDTPQAGLQAGDRLPLAPKWTFSAGAQVDQPLSDNLQGFARADYQYRSSMVDGLNNLTLPAFGSINLRAGIRRDRIAFVLFAENVTNSRGQLSGEATGFLTAVPGAARIHSLRPRTIGGTLSFDW